MRIVLNHVEQCLTGLGRYGRGITLACDHIEFLSGGSATWEAQLLGVFLLRQRRRQSKQNEQQCSHGSHLRQNISTQKKRAAKSLPVIHAYDQPRPKG